MRFDKTQDFIIVDVSERQDNPSPTEKPEKTWRTGEKSLPRLLGHMGWRTLLQPIHPGCR